jgi:hypothetical protein
MFAANELLQWMPGPVRTTGVSPLCFGWDAKGKRSALVGVIPRLSAHESAVDGPAVPSHPNSQRKCRKPSLPCHPERSRGICSYLPSPTNPNHQTPLKFVIPTVT